jgi:hypothetical protein
MPKRGRDDERDDGVSGERNDGEHDEDEALRDTLLEAVNASVEVAQRRGEAQSLPQLRFTPVMSYVQRLLAEATAAAAKVTAEAAAYMAEAEEIRRVVEQDRLALEAEKASMEEVHTFQTTKIILSVGGHRFETSRQTLTSVSGTYLASMFSGRFLLTPDAEGVYFIDRDGAHFRHILNFLRDPVEKYKLNANLNEGHREELMVELEYFGLLDRMLPYRAQERVGQSLLQRACLDGTRRALETAVAQARVLVFDLGSTTPFLRERFQDLRWVITERVVNGSPVWGADGNTMFMYCTMKKRMMISAESHCAAGRDCGGIYNLTQTADVAAPTELPSDEWVSSPLTTLASQYASAHLACPGWYRVPEMRITAVHGLDDVEPAMAAALRQLAALA